MEHKKIERDATDSLAPIQLERRSVEEEVALMGKGQGRSLWTAGALGVLALAGGLVLLQQLEANHRIAQAGEAVTAMDTRGFAAFAHCALPALPATRMDNDDHLRTALERRSERHGRGYAGMLRQCGPPLYELQTALEGLQTPALLGAQRDEMRRGVDALVGATRDYAAYLDARGGYDFVSAQPKIEAFALAWQQYRDARRAMAEGVRAAL